MRRILLAVVVAVAFAALVAATKSKDNEPALVIVCKAGGVHHVESHLASGSACVLHDKSGDVATAGAISVYDDSNAPF